MGAGLTVMNLDSTVETVGAVDPVLSAVSTFWGTIMGSMPTGITVQVDNVAEERNEATGALVSTVSGAGQSPAAGTAPAAHGAGVGCRVRWTTAGVRNGRFVVGTTFIVPCSTAQYESNGTIAGGFITTLQGAADNLLTALVGAGAPLGVWSRPTVSGGSDGVLHPVNAAVVPDQVSWLTSRRS
jgi:hypothetical protein